MNTLHQLWNDETGAVMAEYALLLTLIAGTTITAITSLQQEIGRQFENAVAHLATIY